MKKVCVLIIAFTVLLIPFVNGQSNRGQVILKNGSIIKGKIYSEDEGEKVRVFSAGNMWVFQKSEIEKMEFSRIPRATAVYNDTILSKFSIHAETGVLLGSAENSQEAPLIFTPSVNYSFTNKLSAGFGTGVQFLKETHIPVFGNIEYKFRDSGITPYLFLQAGYLFPAEDATNIYPDVYPYYEYISFRPWYYYPEEEMDAKGGVMLNSGVGFMKMFSPYFGMTFSFGYYFSRLSYSGEDDYQIDLDYNRLSIKLGIIFK